MAEGGGAVHLPFGAPVPALASRSRARGSSPVALVLGVVWLTTILSGVISWTFRELSGSGNYYYIFMGMFVPYFLSFRTREAAWLASRGQFWLWVLTVVVPVVMVLLGGSDPWALQSMKQRIVFFSFVAGSALVLVAPDARRMLRISARIVLVISIPILFYELVRGSVFSVSEGRAAGFYGNPNDAGAALLLCLLLAVDLRRVTTGDLILAAITTAGVIATFSRMAMILAIPLFAAYALAPPPRGRRGATGQRALVLGAIAFAAVVAIVWVSQNVELSDEARMRVQSILTGNVSDASSQARVEVAEYSLGIVRENPWGNGVGFVERKDLEPHNTYLYLAIDYGIPGLLFYAAILLSGLVAGLRAGWRRGANAISIAALLIWSSFFTHYVADAGFFTVAFATFITGSMIVPREESRPRDAAPP